MSVAIKFENISKQYRLGLVSTLTLSHDLNRWWAMNVRGKEDPYLTIGSINDRTTKADSDYIWALRDINFEVQHGEILGIIGKNGAGKSTLLKILSKVTSPTTGQIKARGRIASLLEVGTGFHPEMTGRENIYMNGAIMGMTKAEIRRRMDEIIDFSGCERYIDTPVKRYSSGMTVRLGFAIAAHLEPEILVVDEVLAVGDAEFQKKAIGKMQDISKGEGRTVLFVSHNMPVIRNLCSKSILLVNGQIDFEGETELCINNYTNDNKRYISEKIIKKIDWLTSDLIIHLIEINGKADSELILRSNENEINFKISGTLVCERRMSFAVCFYDENDYRIATYDPAYIESEARVFRKGDFVIEHIIKLPRYINKGIYKLDIFLLHPNVEYLLKAPASIKLQIDGSQAKNGDIADSKTRGFMFLEGVYK
jgi:lipopolysaccharide transport system ATP-binding protein